MELVLLVLLVIWNVISLRFLWLNEKELKKSKEGLDRIKELEDQVRKSLDETVKFHEESKTTMYLIRFLLNKVQREQDDVRTN